MCVSIQSNSSSDPYLWYCTLENTKASMPIRNKYFNVMYKDIDYGHCFLVWRSVDVWTGVSSTTGAWPQLMSFQKPYNGNSQQIYVFPHWVQKVEQYDIGDWHRLLQIGQSGL
jgi:hypothetical protein